MELHNLRTTRRHGLPSGREVCGLTNPSRKESFGPAPATRHCRYRAYGPHALPRTSPRQKATRTCAGGTTGRSHSGPGGSWPTLVPTRSRTTRLGPDVSARAICKVAELTNGTFESGTGRPGTSCRDFHSICRIRGAQHHASQGDGDDSADCASGVRRVDPPSESWRAYPRPLPSPSPMIFPGSASLRSVITPLMPVFREAFASADWILNAFAR